MKPVIVLLAAGLMITGCRKGMVDQQHLKPLAEENFFTDGRGSRVPPPHTVARGQLRADEQFYTGRSGDKLAAPLPMSVTRELLSRGRQRFDLYCAGVHGRSGARHGRIGQHGFPRPPSVPEPPPRHATGSRHHCGPRGHEEGAAGASLSAASGSILGQTTSPLAPSASPRVRRGGRGEEKDEGGTARDEWGTELFCGVAMKHLSGFVLNAASGRISTYVELISLCSETVSSLVEMV